MTAKIEPISRTNLIAEETTANRGPRAYANAILLNSAQRLTDSDGPESFLAYVLTEIAHLVGASTLYLLRYTPADNTLTLHLSYLNGRLRQGPSGEEFAILAQPVPADITPAFAIMCRERRFITPANCPIAPEEFAWPGWIEAAPQRQLSDSAHLALFVGDLPVGTLGMEFQDGKRLGEEDQPLVQGLAKQAALALRLVNVAEQERNTAIRHEQEKAAQQRSAALVKANTVLQRSIRSLSSISDLDQFLTEMLTAILDVTGAHNGAVVVVRGEEAEHVVLIEHGKCLYREEKEHQGIYRVPINPSLRAYLEDARCRGDAWSPPPEDISHTPVFVEYHQSRGNRAVRNVTLAVGDRLVGWLGLGFATPVPMTDEQVQLLRLLADQMSVAVEMARMAEEAKEVAVVRERERTALERAAELAKANEALRRSVSQLAGMQDVSHYIDRVLLSSIEQAQASGGALFNFNADQDAVQMQSCVLNGALADIKSDPRLQIWRAPYPTTTFQQGWNEMLSTPEGYFVAKVEPEEPGMAPGVAAWHIVMGNHSVANFPLLRGDDVVGFIGLTFNAPCSLTSEKCELVRALAQQATLALELTRLADESKQTAIAKEREMAAQERAAELAKANEALRRSADRLATASNSEDILTIFLSEAVAVANAQDGAVLRRVAGTEFAFVVIQHQGELLRDEALQAVPMAQLMRERSRRDEAGYLARIVQGQTMCWKMEDLAAWFPEAAAYFEASGHQTAWDIPYTLNGEVAGYLGLSFKSQEGPSILVAETITALASQIAVALELTRLSEADKHAAIAKEQEKATQERAAELAKANEALRRAADGLAKASGNENILTVLLREAVIVSNASAGAALTRDRQTTGFDFAAIYAEGEIFGQPTVHDHPLAREVSQASREDRQGYFAALARGETQWRAVTSPLARDLPLVTAFHRDAGRQTIWDIPFLLRGEVAGYLSLVFARDNPISPSITEAVAALATQTSLALELTRLSEADKQAAIAKEQEKAAQERASELAKLNEELKREVLERQRAEQVSRGQTAAMMQALNVLAAETDLSAFLSHVLCAIATQLDTQMCALYFHDRKTDLISLRMTYHYGQTLQGDEQAGNPSAGNPHRAGQDGFWATHVKTRRPFIVPDISRDPFFYQFTWLTHLGIQSLFSVPLVFGEEVIGYLVVRSKEKHGLCQVFSVKFCASLRMNSVWVS